MPSAARTIMQKLWQPRRLIDASQVFDIFAIVVLNRPISVEKHLTQTLWNAASKRVLVDGGTNRWLRFTEKLNETERSALLGPHMITGDFDSVSAETLATFEATGTQVIRTPEQDETDFTKSLTKLLPFIETDKPQSIVTLVDNAGRIDHTMANINTMVKSLAFLPGNVTVFALCAESISWLLVPGEHRIEVPAGLVAEQRWCSYVPISGSANVSTTGFKWDLDNHPVQFGGMVSTSNTYAAELLTVRTDGLLYFSMGIGNFTDDAY